MLRKNSIFLWLLIFSLLLSLSCSRKTAKPPQGAVGTNVDQGTSIKGFEFTSLIKTIKAGDVFTFSVKGGIAPLRFSTTLGHIDRDGLYTAPQYSGSGYVIVTDSKNNKIYTDVSVYTPLKISPSSLTLTPNKKFQFSASGGFLPYTFTSGIGSILNTGDYTAPDTQGQGNIILTDDQGNQATSHVTINPNLKIVPTDIILNINSEYKFQPEGGVPPFSYSTTLGTINSSGVYYSSFEAGSGVVEVKDSLGNTAKANVSVISGLGITPSRINLLINSHQQFSASGGLYPYTFSNTSGSITEGGYYTAPPEKGYAIITVKDKRLNVQTAEVNIYRPLKIIPADKVLAVGNTTIFSASEGVPPYEFSTDIGTINISSGFFTAPSNPGLAKVTVTDQEKNKIVANVQINPKLSISPVTLNLGVKNNYRFIASGGVPDYNFSAVRGSIGNDGEYIAPDTTGSDNITVTDSLGNQAVSNITINPKLGFTVPSKTMRPGEYFTFTATGGAPFEASPHYLFSADYGAIDQFGLYQFPEGIDWDVVTAEDKLGEMATASVKGNFIDFWTWMVGTDSINMESSNTPGGKFGSARWTDFTGNLWLFGGAKIISNSYTYYNELWKYETNSKKWILVPSSSPVGRYYPSSWSDSSGNLWLFGGGAYGGGGPTSGSVGLNDLWKYNPTINDWRLMSGSTTPNQPGVYDGENRVPSSRLSAASWTQSGNLWLFGGFGKGTNPGYLNDLWKYNIDTGKWIFVKGPTSPSQPGVYGGFRIPSQNNMPGARAYAVSWSDSSGNLWLFGGYGYSASGEPGFLNDLWKFDIVSNQWTWMGGSDSINRVGNYGNIGVASTDYFPGGKRSACGWADKSGNLWLFGGRQESTTSTFLYNDLWKYNIGAKTWTWVSGSKVTNQSGNYGRMGVTLGTNVPGARESDACWFDKDENLWLFGGYGKNSSSYGYLNDLWKFTTK